MECESTSAKENCSSYSRAQRYGSKARILGRAHVCRLKGDFFPAIFYVVVEQLVMMEGHNFLEVAASENGKADQPISTRLILSRLRVAEGQNNVNIDGRKSSQ